MSEELREKVASVNAEALRSEARMLRRREEVIKGSKTDMRFELSRVWKEKDALLDERWAIVELVEQAVEALDREGCTNQVLAEAVRKLWSMLEEE